MIPLSIAQTIENLPKAGFFAYITYRLHRLLAHWQLILGFGMLLALVVFFLIPLAKNSGSLTPEWRVIALVTFLGSLIITAKLCQIAQKRLFEEEATTPIPEKTPEASGDNQATQKIQNIIIQGKVEALQTLFEEKEINFKARTSPKDWPILHLITIGACRHRAFLPLLKQVLEQEEVPLNLVGIKGFTPLHLAACLGNKAVCELLIQSGANPNAKNKQSQRPWQIAWEKGHKKLALYLYKACENPSEQVMN